MKEAFNLPLSSALLTEYGGTEGLRQELSELGCQGIEGIWSLEPVPAGFSPELITGYHLTFYSDWLDFYREDKQALTEKFGSLDAARSFYGGWGAEYILAIYREDLARAKALGAEYLVFHVSDASAEENFTYCWRHSHQEVIDASAEILRTLLAEEEGDFLFLLENQWWPGFTLTKPALTERLLEGVSYPRTGILLDTGHLLNTNPALRTEAEGAAYIQSLLDAHGSLCQYIRGVHFHQSLSGAHVQAHWGRLPEDLPEDPGERFAAVYRHILQIDRHQPWTVPEAAAIVERLEPAYLTHELAAGSRAARRQAVLRQRAVLENRI